MNIRQGILWDSRAILALLDANDADHARAVQVAGQIASERRSVSSPITSRLKQFPSPF
jgi:hypothetical protein